MSKSVINTHGRGARINHPNKFEKHHQEWDENYLEYCRKEGESAEENKTRYLFTDPKSIVNKVTSPDVGMSWSMNPYQGCEHGCIYCYARNTHEYWGLNAGLDFERTVLVKRSAPDLLEKKLRSRNWEAETIVLSGNTDCYQPAEKKFQITKKCLEVFLKYQHPVSIITKNGLILRDLKILAALHEYRLTGVHISITTLEEKTRRLLEPRTASIKKRLQTVTALRKEGIPVNVMVAPIIPGLNSHEILPIAEAARDAGANSIGYTVVRLNGAVGPIFTDWVQKTLPDRAQKIISQIKECHGGQLNDSRYGVRNKGEGVIASQIQHLIRVAKNKYFNDAQSFQLNTALYEGRKKHLLRNEGDQLTLF
ncbi:PA0069 family radical SAM protein [Robertkochia marina]|uniref:PA0069 family radical SAM protein n=1 Tax=Robertkochia marina TaxID=1227945 RepID=A0A4S3M262_9FLAO|nr:PA0069 family radical SAM protein [Robertkochia marina]THD69113.1 PA0069 family radical SAM protein [Robertkochia marina]TRZ47628.1 PA0069 family radical SAM protein [Robertkochia marina]